MDPTEKFYIRNIVLSYLEACLINRDPQRKIQEEIATKRMTVLNAIIQHKPEAEIQAVYAIQNFVSKLEHPPSEFVSRDDTLHSRLVLCPCRNGSTPFRYLLR